MVAVPAELSPSLSLRQWKTRMDKAPKLRSSSSYCCFWALCSTVLGSGTFPRDGKGEAAAREGQGLCGWSQQPPQQRGIKASHSSKSTFETDYIPAFCFWKCVSSQKMHKLNIFTTSKHFLWNISRGTNYQKAPTNFRQIKMFLWKTKSWKHFLSNSVGGQDWKHLEMSKVARADGSREVALKDAWTALSCSNKFLIQIEMFDLIKFLLLDTSQLYCVLGDCARWMVFIKLNKGSFT